MQTRLVSADHHPHPRHDFNHDRDHDNDDHGDDDHEDQNNF